MWLCLNSTNDFYIIFRFLGTLNKTVRKMSMKQFCRLFKYHEWLIGYIYSYWYGRPPSMVMFFAQSFLFSDLFCARNFLIFCSFLFRCVGEKVTGYRIFQSIGSMIAKMHADIMKILNGMFLCLSIWIYCSRSDVMASFA